MISEQWIHLIEEIDLQKASREFLAENLMILLGEFKKQKAKLDLSKSQSLHLEHALCQAADVIMVTDLKGKIRLSNPALQDLLGWQENFYHYWSQDANLTELQACQRQLKEWKGILTSVDQRARFRVQASLIQESDGTIERSVITLTPIEEELRLTESLKQQKEFLTNLLNLMEVSLLALDDEGKLYLDNLAAKTLMADLGEEGFERLLDALKQVRQEEEKVVLRHQTREYRFLVRAQELPLSYLRGPGVPGMINLYTLSDVTQSEGLQAELFAKSQALSLEEVHKKLARQEFMMGMVLRLQQNLNLAKAAMVTLGAHTDQEQSVRLERLKEPLGQIESELRTYKITHQEETRFRGESKARELARTLGLLYGERARKEGVELLVDLSSPEPHYPVSQIGMLLLFRILIDNAFDGVLSQEADKDKRIRISLWQDERGMGLSVEDSGPGIPGHLQSKIFEPLFSTKPEGEGLSLTLLYRVLTRAEGQTECFDSPLGGAGMRLFFKEADHA